ncbi:MFS transporter [Microbacterium pseudoresistens]|uniref:MFS family permease n=1 Tax=Microbacterium pseudoresistens TaxID=640634 RepID=A0A7Y9EWC6_9MICO|nr:MFS transporter [Microbacterium pseudoresistens]NYD55169.1 MFS family permease [Microbacterium pseudoresistens]
MTTTSPCDSDADRSLFRRAGAAYFVIAFIARLPFAMIVVGVLTLAVEARGSVSLAGLTSAAVGVGTACFGPLLGAAADRFGQRPVLLVLAAGNAAALVLLTVVAYAAVPDAVLLLSAFAVGATAPQVAPLSRSRLVTLIMERMPETGRARTLSSTLSYESAADETVFVFGPFVVGALASLLGPAAPLLIGAALSLLSVGAFALHPSASWISVHRRADGGAASSVSELFRSRLLVVVFGIFGVGLLFGTVLTALTAFMADRGEADAAGLLYGVMGIGSAIFALGIAALPQAFSLRLRWLVFAGILLGGTLILLTVNDVGGMILALGVMGIGIGPTLVTQFGFGTAASPAGRSATVMTMLGSSVIVGQAVGSALTGVVAEQAGTSVALLLPIAAAASIVAAGIVNVSLNPRTHSHRHRPQRDR